MKLLISLVMFVFFFGCSQNSQVYWCGDHACINKKEKEEYFKKTMTVEVKSFNKRKKKDLSDLEIIKNRSGLFENEILNSDEEVEDNSLFIKKNNKKLEKKILAEQKREIKEEKKRLKQAKIRAKKNEQAIKKLEKQTKLKKKKLEKKQKKSVKQKKRDEKKKNSSFEIETSTELGNVVVSLDSTSAKFSELVEKIYKKNKFKSYPNINDIP